jgi:hypothetical protein
MRGNYLLYALEAILFILAVITFAFTSQQALQGILLVILVASALHAAISGVTVCSGWKKWTMLGLTAPVIITSIIMLIMNLQTDKDASATPPTVAIGSSWKIALVITCGILPLANATLVGDGSQWRCTSGLICTNSTETDSLKTSVRRYINAATNQKLSTTGPLAPTVNLNNLRNDNLETLKIKYITVDDNGNDALDCLGFKQAIDAAQVKLVSDQRQTQINQRQSQIQAKQDAAKISFDNRNLPNVYKVTDPSAQQKPGGIFGGLKQSFNQGLINQGVREKPIIPPPLPPAAPVQQMPLPAVQPGQLGRRVGQVSDDDDF